MPALKQQQGLQGSGQQCRRPGTSQAPLGSALNGLACTQKCSSRKLTQREETVGGGAGAAQVDNCQDLGRGAGQGHGGGAVARHQDGRQDRLCQVGCHAGVGHIGHKLAQLGLLEDLQGPGMQESHLGGQSKGTAWMGNSSSQGILGVTSWVQNAEMQDTAECKAAAEHSQQDDITSCPGDSQSGRG